MFFLYVNWTCLMIEQVWNESLYFIDLTKVLPKDETTKIYSFVHTLSKHLLIMYVSDLLQHSSNFVYGYIYFYLECFFVLFLFSVINCLSWEFWCQGTRSVFREIAGINHQIFNLFSFHMEKGQKTICSYQLYIWKHD